MRPSGSIAIVLGICSLVLLAGCSLPDRQPVGPVEITRPEFHGVTSPDSGAVEVDLRAPVRLSFSEPVDPSTGDQALSVAHEGDVASGSFSTQDSSLIFTPAGDYMPSTIYHVILNGEVRDVHGNSLSIDPEYGDTTWFMTIGDYAEGGWYPVYTLDKINKLILAGTKFDATALNDTIHPVDGPEMAAVTPDGAKVLVTYKVAAGYVTIFDRDMSGGTDVLVGLGPVDVVADNNNAFVVNQSGRTLSKVDIAGATQLTEKTFDDGFRPRNIAYDRDGGRLFLTSNYNQDPGAFRVVDASSMDVTLTPANPLPMADRSAGIVYADNEVFVLEDNTGRILVVNPSDGTVADSILVMPGADGESILGAGLVAHGSDGFLYTTNGILVKLDLAARTDVRHLKVSNSIKSLDMTPAGDLLFAATPSDTTYTVLDPEYLYVLGTARTTATSNVLAVGRAK